MPEYIPFAFVEDVTGQVKADYPKVKKMEVILRVEQKMRLCMYLLLLCVQKKRYPKKVRATSTVRHCHSQTELEHASHPAFLDAENTFSV
ncbi:hypothetical protein [uncultured Bacteroides sp.]|uniref:hypothetical protein n=1 Tax=uncultured Bacteroides sp. TaxID=162156 RepID=UPI002AA5E440|nr:hypothetical protein [uncultured Bacteroides sp.]